MSFAGNRLKVEMSFTTKPMADTRQNEFDCLLDNYRHVISIDLPSPIAARQIWWTAHECAKHATIVEHSTSADKIDFEVLRCWSLCFHSLKQQETSKATFDSSECILWNDLINSFSLLNWWSLQKPLRIKLILFCLRIETSVCISHITMWPTSHNLIR